MWGGEQDDFGQKWESCPKKGEYVGHFVALRAPFCTTRQFWHGQGGSGVRVPLARLAELELWWFVLCVSNPQHNSYYVGAELRLMVACMLREGASKASVGGSCARHLNGLDLSWFVWHVDNWQHTCHYVGGAW